MQTAVDELYNDRRIRLWVVYVDTFSARPPRLGADTRCRSATSGTRTPSWPSPPSDRAYAFLVPTPPRAAVDVDSAAPQRDRARPAQGDWAGAAVAAASGLNRDLVVERLEISWVGLLVILA